MSFTNQIFCTNVQFEHISMGLVGGSAAFFNVLFNDMYLAFSMESGSSGQQVTAVQCYDFSIFSLTNSMVVEVTSIGLGATNCVVNLPNASGVFCAHFRLMRPFFGKKG
jgi:hypothetical protein